jgi:hypothetical protein
MLLMPRLRLETLPKPSFHMNDAEVAFNSAFFDAAVESATSRQDLTEQASNHAAEESA